VDHQAEAAENEVKQPKQREGVRDYRAEAEGAQPGPPQVLANLDFR
jgi:hypothetical protein